MSAKIYKSFIELDWIPEGNAVKHFYDSPHRKDFSTPCLINAVTGESLTGQQVKDATFRFATVLKEKYDVRLNSVVCVFTSNNIYLQIIHHAVLALGAIVSPVNIMYNATEIAHQARTSRPVIIIADDLVTSTAVAGVAEAATNTVVVDTSTIFKDIKKCIADSSIPYASIVPVDGREHHAYYCFSSGTSGLPKCVITTHTNMMVNVHQLELHRAPLAMVGAVNGAVLPMSHIFGLQVYIWSSNYLGGCTVVFPKFDLEQVLKSICEYKIVSMSVVPPLVLAFAKSPLIDKYPISKYLKYCSSGAAPLSKNVIDAAEARLPGLTICQLYGQTETSPVTIGAAYLIPGYDKNIGIYDKATIGWLCAGTEARLVDPDTGEDTDRGELWIRGPQVMKGYLHNKQATDETLVGDGWMRTGDVAIINETQQFSIVDRIKELIKSKGHQVAPAELEGILLKHDNVTDVAVIGVRDEDGVTEFPRAYLVVTPGADVTKIIHDFNSSVAVHKRLWGGVVVLDQVPKSPSGKILRRLLRDAAATHQAVGAELAKVSTKL